MAAGRANPAAKSLLRLLGVLEIEEEQAQRALEAAAAELRQLERAGEAARERERRGRALIAAGASSRRQDHSAVLNRIAGLEEIRRAQQATAALAPRIAGARAREAALRQAFLAKRVERRQAETLARAAKARQAREAAIHEQQSLDDWFLERMLRARRSQPDADEAQTAGRDYERPENRNPGPVSRN